MRRRDKGSTQQVIIPNIGMVDASVLDLRAFVTVVRRGSFAAAARELRLSTTSVSRRIAKLEEKLGARLLHRTTRKVTLTRAGALAIDRAERALAELQELQDVVASDEHPRGHIRVTASVSLGHALLHERLPAFIQAHPDVSVEVLLTDRRTDLVAERIDLAIRVGELPDSSLVARRLGTVEHLVCAAPSWLERIGPLSVRRIEDYPRIVDTNQPLRWKLEGPDGARVELDATGRYAINSAHAARDACVQGLGLALLPAFVARTALSSGVLIDAFPGWSGPKLGLFSLVLTRRWASPAVRALVEHVQRDLTILP